MKHYFYLNCYYKLTSCINTARDEKLEKLAKMFKGKESGAGTDFNTRDVFFTFDNFKNAKNFYKQAKKVKWISGANISINDKDSFGVFVDIKELLV
jgi:hypothetical protein